MDHWFLQNSLIKVISFTLLLCVLFAVAFYTYTWKILHFDALRVPAESCEIVIVPGTTLNKFAKQLHKSGLLPHPILLRAYLMYKNNTQLIKAGEYSVQPGMTAIQLLNKIFAGDVTQYSLTIVEGWQTSQLLDALQKHPKINATLTGLSTAEIIERLDIPVQHLEGVFLPDTYCFTAQTTDVDFLRRAFFKMQEKLQQAWENRDPNCILADPYAALILASIIEKETSIKTEYAQISGVFTRRLSKNMKLQADPTVIYGLQLNEPLLRRHLRVDNPYNTYRKTGLPPTPIALPSAKAIEAALHPATGNAIYFVATGDGGHIFSATLTEHNKAVRHLYKSRN